MMGDWTFFSNYGHVLVCLARNREARLRDVAAEVGITERAVQKIVRDLQDEGFLAVTKQGRCNRYRINRRKSLRHELESHCTVGKLLALVCRTGPPGSADPDMAEAPPDLAAPPDAQPQREVTRRESTPERVVDTAEPAATASTPDAKPPPGKKPRKKPSTPDTRQQGSLF
jgi:DNA-binding Lrp family transcriptional regulator